MTGDPPASPDPGLASLLGHFPGWEIWRRPEDGMLLAWWVGTSPVVLLSDTNPRRLRKAIERAIKSSS